MKILIIILSLFVLGLQLEAPPLKMGHKISFDYLNHEFVVPYEGPNENNFLFLISHYYQEFGYEIRSNREFIIKPNCDEGNHQFLFMSSGGPIRLNFTLLSVDRGSFIIYDFKAKYIIKLKNKYGMLNIPMTDAIPYEPYAKLAPNLTFLVPNFRTNATIYFEFTKNVHNFSPFSNPFEVCHEKVCKKNVTSFFFEKGKSYEIYIHLQKVNGTFRENYAVPPFSFYAEDFDENYSNDDIEYKYDESSQNDSRLFSKNVIIFITLILILF